MKEKHEIKRCPSCGDHFECKVGSIHLCQCWKVPLHAEEREYLNEKYDECLCAQCLLKERRRYQLKIHRTAQKNDQQGFLIPYLRASPYSLTASMPCNRLHRDTGLGQLLRQKRILPEISHESSEWLKHPGVVVGSIYKQTDMNHNCNGHG